MKLHWLVFVAAAVVCWGAYIPTLHVGQTGFGEQRGPLRAFMFVGVAYFLMAMIIPGILVFVGKQEPNVFAMRGVAFSTLAGALGAAGALGVILALNGGGSPLTVPPLVFCGAPIMSVVVAMLIHKPKSMPELPFYLGICLAAGGVALILRYKPA